MTPSWLRWLALASATVLGALVAVMAVLIGGVATSRAGEQPERLNCPTGFIYERLSGQCCVQDRATLPLHGKIGYTGNSLCEDGYQPEYEQRSTTDGLGPPGCPAYTSFAFLVACRAAGEQPVPAEPAPTEQPVEPAPSSGVSSTVDQAISTVATALTSGPTPVPSAGTVALTGVAGGLVGLLLGTTLLAAPVPASNAAGGPLPRVWDEARRVELEQQRDRTMQAYDELGRLLTALREEIRAGDRPSFDATLRELVGLVITLAGTPGLTTMPDSLFGGLSLAWSTQSMLGDAYDSSAAPGSLDLDEIAANPDGLLARISFERGRLAGQLTDLDRQIEQVMTPELRPDFSTPPEVLTTEQAQHELELARRYRAELEAQITTWDGTAPPEMKSGSSLKDLHDLQDRLHTSRTLYSRLLHNLPTDEQELEDFVQSADWLETARTSMGGMGTVATALGLVGVSPAGTAGVSAGAGGYTVGQSLKGYLQSADMAERRDVVRTMIGNVEHLSGLVKHQIEQGMAMHDQTYTTYLKADQHVRALERHLGLRR
jgi:hypothetical protein